jgi:hypothetical protein
MSTSSDPNGYPIGEPGQPWGDAERAAWRDRQTQQRSAADIVERARRLSDRFDLELQTFEQWLPGNASKIPIEAASTS